MDSENGVVERSPLDKKSYRHMQLANGLSVLLISDPEIKIDANSKKRARSDDGDEEGGEGDFSTPLPSILWYSARRGQAAGAGEQTSERGEGGEIAPYILIPLT